MIPDPQELRSLMDESTFESPYQTPEEYSSGGELEGTKTANLILSQTSTSNPDEPRTLKAGYDDKNFIMTVEFRDGTRYNYYDVPPSMWQEFYHAFSKGRYLKASGLDDWHNKGPAADEDAGWKQTRKKVTYQDLMGRIQRGKGEDARIVEKQSTQEALGQVPNY